MVGSDTPARTFQPGHVTDLGTAAAERNWTVEEHQSQSGDADDFYPPKSGDFRANFAQKWRFQGYIWVAPKVAILGPQNGDFKNKKSEALDIILQSKKIGSRWFINILPNKIGIKCSGWTEDCF